MACTQFLMDDCRNEIELNSTVELNNTFTFGVFLTERSTLGVIVREKKDLNTKFITLYTKFQFDFNFQINRQKNSKNRTTTATELQ